MWVAELAIATGGAIHQEILSLGDLLKALERLSASHPQVGSGLSEGLG